MYVPRTKLELFELIASLFRYAPDLTQWEYVESIDQVDSDFNLALDTIFGGEPEVHLRMKRAAAAAFAECRKGDGPKACDYFGVINDEVMPSFPSPKPDHTFSN